LHVFSVLGKEANDSTNKIVRDVNKIRYNEFLAGQENYPYYIYIEQRDPELPEIAIVTDSTSDLTKEFIGDLGINIIPLKIKLNDNYYRDGVDITKREFWKRLLTEGVIPKTSQPSPAEFKEMYEKLFNKGYKKIISIHISSRLSGTQQAARVAKGMLTRGEDITIIDSKAVTFALGHQVLEAARMVKSGVSYEAILERLYEMQDKMKVYFVVNDLTFLEKGGRIGRASSIIGGLLKVKPVLKLENGEVTVETKTFGERGAFSYMEKLIKNESKKNSIILYTAWGGTNKELANADAIKNTGEGSKKVEYRGRFEIGATIGSHSGPVFGFGMISKIF
ncbi:MAG: DegV family protein, partial [Fusobacterium sp.]|nr:DegV family protein [Fusobacterium sp.]